MSASKSPHSASSKISRNRADYPSKVHIGLQAGADVLFGGDLDKAWEAFFQFSEEDEQEEDGSFRDDDFAILHLRATSQPDSEPSS